MSASMTDDVDATMVMMPDVMVGKIVIRELRLVNWEFMPLGLWGSVPVVSMLEVSEMVT